MCIRDRSLRGSAGVGDDSGGMRKGGWLSEHDYDGVVEWGQVAVASNGLVVQGHRPTAEVSVCACCCWFDGVDHAMAVGRMPTAFRCR
eukprot:3497513-Rhodomonas_salina.1